jgi:ubiquinone/menaquinone biosynthesis C-methylase UbiE
VRWCKQHKSYAEDNQKDHRMSKDLVKEQFGQAAQSYAVSKVHAQGASLARMVELVQPQANWRVLDVATGAGHTAFAFAPHVARVIATDITPEMLATTAKLAQEKGLTNVEVQEADAEALPFVSATFDLVTCRIAPHHFGAVQTFVHEVARVLRPGGLFALVDNIVPGSQASAAEAEEQRIVGEYINTIEKLRDPSHQRCLSMEGWLAMLHTAGFTVLHQEIAPKTIEYLEWVQRMNRSTEIQAAIYDRLVHAPPVVQRHLQVAPAGDDLVFTLAEGLIVGSKD